MATTYDPKGNARDREVDAVHFAEAEPPDCLRGIVHRYLEVCTVYPLANDYRFHALPDACTYLVFNQLDLEITGVTRLKATSEELNLGRMFHFVNIRFLPGVWQNTLSPVSYGLVNKPYTGDLSLVDINRSLQGLRFPAQQNILSQFVENLIEMNLVKSNPVTARIFNKLEDIHSVSDMAATANLSTRQLQRVLIKTTGFTPHDFLKVLRLQQSLLGNPSLSYADQSHFIHCFRKATGYTPSRYARKFDV